MKIKRIRAYQVDLPLREGTYKWSGGKSVSVFDSTVILSYEECLTIRRRGSPPRWMYLANRCWKFPDPTRQRSTKWESANSYRSYASRPAAIALPTRAIPSSAQKPVPPISSSPRRNVWWGRFKRYHNSPYAQSRRGYHQSVVCTVQMGGVRQTGGQEESNTMNSPFVASARRIDQDPRDQLQ